MMRNPLCEKLQREFRGRGVNAPGLASSVSTREVMQRVSRGIDPYEDAPTAVFQTSAARTETSVRREAVSRSTYASAVRTASAAEPVRTRSIDNGRRIQPLDYTEKTSGRMRSRTFEAIRNRGFVLPENIRVPGYTKAYSSAARVRQTAAKYERERAEQMESERSGIYAVPVLGGALEILSDACHWVAESCKSLYRRLCGQVAEERISSAKRSVPVGAITLGIVFVVLLFVIIYSFAEANEVNRDITSLEQRQEALIAEQNELRVDLELRDDIRTIQEIATEKLGMVSSDVVDSRFVTVAGSGAQIELEGENENTDASASGTLLSALQSWATGIRYYFH